MTMGRFSRIALVAIMTIPFVGCGLLNDPRGPSEALGDYNFFSDDNSERAMSLLSRGDYPNAERYALAALRRNPKNPYALYAAGMIYQATGRYDLARQYYDVILANRPQITMTVLADGMPQVRTLVDVAQANMAVIDKITGRSIPRTAAQAGRMSDMTSQFEPQLPMSAGRGMISAEPLDGGGVGSMGAEAAVINRFRILKRLLDEGLITPDEYTRRRSTNIGALTPISAKLTPAQGLQRPGPTDVQVLDRLRELSKALESRAISPSEHSAERLVILDALLPAEPRKVDMPVLPPKDVMEAATAVGRVERLRASGLVSAEEAKREKDAVERVLDSQLAKVPLSGTATGLRQGVAPSNGNGAKDGANGVGVTLATVKTEDDARATWEKIKGKYPEELGAMNASMRKVDMGEKGIRWKVVAGPLKSKDEARKLCKVLKLYRQACDPTSY
jgi:tetratricopeptide (TPR) repeat protein